MGLQESVPAACPEFEKQVKTDLKLNANLSISILREVLNLYPSAFLNRDIFIKLLSPTEAKQDILDRLFTICAKENAEIPAAKFAEIILCNLSDRKSKSEVFFEALDLDGTGVLQKETIHKAATVFLSTSFPNSDINQIVDDSLALGPLTKNAFLKLLDRNPSWLSQPDLKLHSTFMVACVASGETGGIRHYKYNSHEIIDTGFTPLECVNYLCYSFDKQFIYATCEGDPCGSIASFKVDGSRLVFLNSVSSGGNAPCYLSCNQTNSFLYVANYGENGNASLAEIALNSDGTLSNNIRLFKHEGSGPVADRQEGSHVHCSCVTPDNKFVIAVDLGIDALVSYPIDPEKGINGEKKVTHVPAGSGPRHILFEKDGGIAYVVTELGNTVLSFAFNDGHFEILNSVSTLPSSFVGASYASAIKFAPDGKALVVSNRGYDSIAIISIDNKGSLELKSIVDAEGEHPRDIGFVDQTDILVVANRFTNNIVLMKYADMSLHSIKTGVAGLALPVGVLS